MTRYGDGDAVRQCAALLLNLCLLALPGMAAAQNDAPPAVQSEAPPAAGAPAAATAETTPDLPAGAGTPAIAAAPASIPSLDAWARQQLHPAPSAPATTAPLNEQAIRLAIRQALAEEQASLAAEQAKNGVIRHDVDTLRIDKYQGFGAAFASAKLPDCLHADGLKNQPTGIGPFAFTGALALPFILVAKLRGVCS